MSKQKELAQNTAVILFGKICTQLINFFLLPFYTAILSTSEYGTVDIVITYSALIIPLITLALEQALFRFMIDIRGKKEKESEIISTVVFVTLVVLLCCLLIVSSIIFITQKTIFLYFGLILIGSATSALALQIARGFGDNIGYTLGSTISAIVQIVLNVLFLAVFNLGVSGMIFAIFLGNMACGILIYFRCHIKQYLGVKYIHYNIFKQLSKYSIPLIPNQLSWWALNASDRVIVQFFIGLAGNGLIAVANKFSVFYINFSNIFNITWTESAALHINDNDAEEFFEQTINTVYKLFLSICCGIIVSMPFVFHIMINSQYDETYGLIPIFMIGSLFNVIVSLYGVIYVAHKKTVEIAKTAIYAASLNIISHLMLIHFIGIYAAAVSTAVGYGGMAIYRYFHSRKYMTIKFTNKTIILSLLMLLISLLSYYSRIKWGQAISFVFILITSIIINKHTLLKVLSFAKRKIRNLNNPGG